MSQTFHVVAIINGERKEFDLDPYAHPDNGTGIFEALEGEGHLDWGVDKCEIIEVDGVKFDKDRPFSACVMCDGCNDGPGDPEDWGDRGEHIIPVLLEKMIQIGKESNGS